MKRILILISIFALLFTMPVYAVPEEDEGVNENAAAASSLPDGVGLSAQSAIIINADSGLVHFASNERERRSIASTTKIMTALVILENANLDEVITTTDEMVGVEGTSIGLLAGDSISYRTLVYGMLLESGNDAANAAAIAYSGSIEEFSKLMNKRASEMGLTDTSFANPSGLEAENHYSTAYDMAKLGAEALKNPLFAEICATQSIQVEYGNPPYKRTLRNHNKLLTTKKYDGANGIKTGYTKKAGRCLVSSVTQNNTTFVCVTLGAPDDWNDHKKMYDYIISNYTAFEANTDLGDIKLSVAGGFKDTANIACKAENKTVMAPAAIKDLLVRRVRMRKFEYAPIEEGTKIGAVEYLFEGTVVISVPIYTTESVAAKTTGWFSAYARALAG